MPEYYSIGKSELRLDALEKVTGTAVYTGDVRPNGMLYGKVLGSPIPHGIIKSIDTSKAEKLPGVVAVITGGDCPPFPTVGSFLKDKFRLARGKVRYIGDAVAAVAATTEEIANAALRLIEVEYEPLPFVLDAEEAFMKDCPVVLHDNVENYMRMELHGVQFKFDKEHPNQVIHRMLRNGDVEKGFAEADVVMETQRYVFPLVNHCYMEPMGAIAASKPDGGVEVWASEQTSKIAAFSVSMGFRIPLSKVHMHIPYVGGGFGAKAGNPMTDLAVMLSQKTNRPVKLMQTRPEVFSGAGRSSAVVYIRDGYKKDGTLTAREITAYINAGAYSASGLIMLNDTQYGAVGTYKQPNLKIDVYGVYTNTPPASPYRGLGSELMVTSIESNVEKAADLLGIDAVELRRINMLQDGDLDAHGQVTINNSARAALDAAAEKIGWGSDKRSKEGPWCYGKGIAVANMYTNFDPLGSEAQCSILQDGTLEIRTSHIELGQGSMTADAQAAAEEFKLPMDKILMLTKDMQNTPFDEGSFAERGTFINGNAIRLASIELKKKIFEAASEIMQVSLDKLDTANGMVFEIGNTDHTIPFSALYMPGGCRHGGLLTARATYMPPAGHGDPETGKGDVVLYYAHGSRAVEVKVNEETGEVRVIKAAGYFDCGTVVNQATCEGQAEGGLAMGIGQSLLEEGIFNSNGKVINDNFRDYKVPTFMDVPHNCEDTIGFVGRPYELGPNGAKGVGEVTLMPVLAAIKNAVKDAIGIEINELPLSRERVLEAIRVKNNQ